MKKNEINEKKVTVKERIKGFYYKHEKAIKVASLAALSAGCAAAGIAFGLWLGNEDPNGTTDFWWNKGEVDGEKALVFHMQEKVHLPGHAYFIHSYARKSDHERQLLNLKNNIEEILAQGVEEVNEEVSK